jgi:hypothetical protein
MDGCQDHEQIFQAACAAFQDGKSDCMVALGKVVTTILICISDHVSGFRAKDQGR